MKKILAALVLAAFLISPAAAQQSEQGPGLTPGHPLYGIEVFVEIIEVQVAGMIGGEELRAKAMANNAEERLNEARALKDLNQSDRAEQALQRYERTINQSREAAGRSSNNSLETQIDRIEKRNREVLKQVRERTPPQADRGLDKALKNTDRAPEPPAQNDKRPERRTTTDPPENPADKLSVTNNSNGSGIVDGKPEITAGDQVKPENTSSDRESNDQTEKISNDTEKETSNLSEPVITASESNNSGQEKPVDEVEESTGLG